MSLNRTFYSLLRTNVCCSRGHGLKIPKRWFTPANSAVTTSLEFLRHTAATTQWNSDSPRHIQSSLVNVDGVFLHLEQCGMGRHMVLLMPGFLGSTRKDFGAQLENLNKDMFTMFSVDPQGYGKSFPLTRKWTMDYHKADAENAATIMKRLWEEQDLGATKYSVVGVNDGGVSAILLAARYPERVKNLITIGTGAQVTQDDRAVYQRLSDMSSWAPRAREELLKMYEHKNLNSDVQGWLKTHQNIYDLRNGDLCELAAASVRCPSLIVHGAEDPIVNSHHAGKLQKLIKGSRLHIFPKGKHYVHLRYPRQFNSLLERFLVE